MKNIIFYFTGTGNSLVVARDIAKEINGTELYSISNLINQKNINLTSNMIGFVFPVYYAKLPLIVKNFIKKIHFNKNQYIYGIITFSGIYGSVFSHLDNYILKRGGTLNSIFKIRMPGNYINKYGAFPNSLQTMLFHKQKYETKQISAIIKNKENNKILKSTIFSIATQKYIKKKFANLCNLAKYYHTTSNCNSCGLCVKLCPVNNIKFINKKPKWSNLCIQCVACIQWCPNHAIEFSKKTINKARYTHPEIKALDLLENPFKVK